MRQFRNTYYYVTSCGKVWSEKSKKFMKPEIGKDGYQRLVLYINGKPLMMLLHRIVAECYISNPDNLPIVNHKDTIKLHCYYKNLEWATTSYNNKHAIDNGLHRKLSDGLNGMAKGIEVLEDGIWVYYEASSTLARKLGIDRSTVTKALKKGYKVKGCEVRYKQD